MTSIVSTLRQRFGQSPVLIRIGAIAVSFLVIFSRRPDAVLNPQFWAEDGKVWYADAYNHGIAYSLLTPEAGYYQTLSRLVAVFAQFFPLAYGPVIFNLAAISVKLIVVNFLLSSRLSSIIPSLFGRMVIAFVYLALPHSAETNANLTNAQWHLALLSFMILIAPRSERSSWRVFDVIAVTLSALSGPLCLLLLPIAIAKFFQERRTGTLVPVAIIAIGTIVQIIALLTTERPSTQPLGAEFGLAMKIIAGHLFISSIIGERGHGSAIKYSLLNDVTAVLTNLAGFGLFVYAFVRSRLELRLLIVFSLMVFCTALASPAITSHFPQWTIMWLPGAGSRYWLIPIFCFFVTLLYLAKHAELPAIRYISIAGLLFSLAGIAADWRNPGFKDLDFQSHAARFEEAARGEEVSIPINPDWEMRLTKK